MGGNTTNVDGVGSLNYQRAIDIARNTEGDLDPTVDEYLERAVSDIWERIQGQPETYVLTKDEFAVFNFYIRRFEGINLHYSELTPTHDGELELTDGSSNATVDLVDSGRPGQTCQRVLVFHSFAYSYGVPFVGNYTPPSCTFNRVTWNLTVTSAGRQYDRLGTVSFGDIEVFRTSTAEPTADGIEWTYLKDMTSYLSLLKQDQKIIFDLGNIITDVYTAAFNVTLTAAYFTAEDTIAPADLILPVSKRLSAENMASVFTVPGDTASNVITLPQNVKKAIFTIAATGQSEEEFWWSNVLQSEASTFPDYGLLYGYSPFREVQLFIDGMLAGVAWPFPVIFTGGVVPGLWRPIVGVDAFDLKEDEIDITPWLPLLCDGKAHNFTIRISGLNDNGNGTASLSDTTDSYWLVDGKVFIWLDDIGHVTTGDGPYKVTPDPTFQVSSAIAQSANGTNETLLYQVTAQRTISLHSTISLSTGNETASWQQSLSFSNAGNFTDGGNVEVNDQVTVGYDLSSSGYAKQFTYPLYAYSVYATIGDNISYIATVRQGKEVHTLGQPVFPTGVESFAVAEGVSTLYPGFQGALLSTSVNGSATYLANETSKTSFSFGSTVQDMVFAGISVDTDDPTHAFPPITSSHELFHRHVAAINATVTEDEETLVDETIGHLHGRPGSGRGFALTNGPGRGSDGLSTKRRRV
ncbi:hypothetical protein LTR36_005042 [Oleoguttula mirabilis]|uniref:Peptide N-acetyl-beta-D-glucosaminyl asparaginase amidase A N-terminal domain-containing protein n=1 Tax=Oleoguttula mirabilis TaxID=1507867 RepID=A0AAV9JVV5_9PEZI|nr:hypothetical protein LTR36_005042 [Oleoguttula mirabilis]